MEGYAKIGERVALHPELGIYRRFAALNAQNLLYLQAEIHELEADLRRYAQEDADSPKPSVRTQFSRNWHKLAHAVDANTLNDERDRRQWNTVVAIRAKLKEYNEMLAQQAIVSQHYRSPHIHDLDILRTCLNSPRLPDYLLGLDSNIWDTPSLKHDLITLNTSDGSNDDAFTTWIASHVVEPFHNLIGRHLTFFSSTKTSPSNALEPDFQAEGIVSYSDRAIARFASLLITVVSSVFPIVGVIILYFVKGTLARLGIIAGFTAAFSFAIAILTNARKAEIFGATAAFSAVLVVFLGSN